MKIYGSLTRIVDLIFRKSGFNVTVQPVSASADTVFQLPAADGGTKAILTADSTATLTNKTFDANGTGNSITNIENADIAAGAAIAFSKLASLGSGHIIVGDAGVPTDVLVSGDISIDNAGVVAISTGVIVNADINASAAIAYSKLAALTASRALQSDGSGFVSASSVTSTELGYLSGVTSNIQTQLDSIAYGVDWKASVRVATTAEIDLSQDLEDGDTIDGVTLATGDRVLVKNQATNPEENGIYVVVASGAASRSVDANTSAKVTTGLSVWVSEGSQADSAWVLTTDDPITLGTTELVFVQFATFDTGGKANVSLNNLSSVAINTTLVSDTNNTDDLGTASIGWKEGFINKVSMDSNSQTTSIQGSASASASVTYSLPPADGTGGYVLSTNGSGVLSWVSNASLSSVDTTWTSGTTKNVDISSLNTTRVNVVIYEIDSPFEEVMVDSVAHTDASNLDLTSSEAPTGSGWRVVVTKMV